MENLELTSGLRRMPVIVDGLDTGRAVIFNPADQEFAEMLYALVDRIGKIHEEKNKLRESETDLLKKFVINREEDKEMREAVDSVFGEGFSDDVFQVRLFALSEGLTVVEIFLFAILEEMEAAVTENMAKRNSRIGKYTAKYRKYK